MYYQDQQRVLPLPRHYAHRQTRRPPPEERSRVHRVAEAINCISSLRAFRSVARGETAVSSPNESPCLNFRKDVRLATGGDRVFVGGRASRGVIRT